MNDAQKLKSCLWETTTKEEAIELLRGTVSSIMDSPEKAIRLLYMADGSLLIAQTVQEDLSMMVDAEDLSEAVDLLLSLRNITEKEKNVGEAAEILRTLKSTLMEAAGADEVKALTKKEQENVVANTGMLIHRIVVAGI